jgi:hypothetical protein
MKTVYLIKDYGTFKRKIVVDIAYLVSNKKLRVPKVYYEEDLYLPYIKDLDNPQVEKLILSKDKIISEDEHHFFFDVAVHPSQIEAVFPTYI